MARSDKPMQGKVCMVTGAASGIGAITAQALAQQGATVILVDRDSEKSAVTVNRIKQQTGNPAVEFMWADLSVQKEIRQLAQQFRSHYQRLDVLVNNAGAIFARRQETVDGIEMTFALNYLGQFLLTNLLLDTIKASAPARIINVSSRSHARARIDPDDLQSRSGYKGLQAYAHSKLAIVLFTYELARRLEGTGVTANTLHPGVVATDFAMNNGGIVGLAVRLFRSAFISPEQGAQTSIYLATSPEVEGVTGKYFVKCNAVPSSPASYDTATARRLWQASAALTNPYEIVLRPASHADSEFVYQIKKATLRECVDQIWGWDESQQRDYHKSTFDPSDMRIVLSGRDRIGVLSFSADDSCVDVSLICLDPRYQNRGIGSFLMQWPIEEARSRGVPITLTVLKPNPVTRFYERLGFRIVSEDNIRYYLKRSPQPAAELTR